MSIPDFDQNGFLPPGLHECMLEDIKARFGSFRETDWRCRLFDKLESLVNGLKSTGMVSAIIVDGSFVTATPEPGDIDLIVVLGHSLDPAVMLRPFEYNVLSRRMVARRYGFDLFVVEEDSAAFWEQVEFFMGVRQQPNARKGLLRLQL